MTPEYASPPRRTTSSSSVVKASAAGMPPAPGGLRRYASGMTLLDHVVLQVDDLDAVGTWYDQIVSLAGGARTFDMPNLIGYALPGEPTQLLFSQATDAGGRQTHLALTVK